MAEYRGDFKLMSGSMIRLSDEVLESTFVKRLKPDIQNEVRVLKPNG